VAVFEAWLLVERRRLGSVAQGVLRDAALDALAAGSIAPSRRGVLRR
jgi:hypothetical protein